MIYGFQNSAHLIMKFPYMEILKKKINFRGQYDIIVDTNNGGLRIIQFHINM